MKFAILILTLLAGHNITGQVTTEKRLVSVVTVDKYFKDTLTFNKNWSYPWYIVVDNNGGNMENTLGGKLTETDTVHLYHTANCWTNHQGRHKIRYCDAILYNDTISLFLQPELPAYASQLLISIEGSLFWSDFSATYPVPTGKLSWIVNKQKLVLDKKSYMPGDTIKGYLEVEFIETSVEANQKNLKKKYYYKGYIKTPLLNKE
jgi:hypothetical protein